jgi:hypothetical protein
MYLNGENEAFSMLKGQKNERSLKRAFPGRQSLLCVVFAFGFNACGNDTDSQPGAQGIPKASIAHSDLFDRGFSVAYSNKCATQSSVDCPLEVIAPPGKTLRYEDLLDLRDSRQVGTYTVFAWPQSLPHRDYDALGAQMRQYSELVGTLLHRAPAGPGEVSWRSHIRSSQYMGYTMAAIGGSRAFCNVVVEQLVDRLVPEGSTYIQYGNCGEGGRVGACLAKSAGFKDTEIRVCASTNDHFFAMVKHDDPKNKWCILDRWKIAGDNFRCGVDLDTTKKVVTIDGVGSTAEWFQNVTCITFKDYIANGASIKFN